MIFSLVSTFLFAFLSPLLILASRTVGVVLSVAFPLLLTAGLLISGALSPEAPTEVFRASWIPNLGMDFVLRSDGLSRYFILLITSIGSLISLYTAGYLREDPRLGRFYGLLFFFMASMIGLVVSGDLISTFVFWELTSVASFFLIAFDHERIAARNSALQALLVTGLGGLALLSGFILIGSIAGSFSWDEILSQKQRLIEHPVAVPALILMLIGAATKSAQVPFHFWLPNAMQAPTPVSAFLHSATMVTAGVFLVARLFPLFSSMPEWQSILIPIGALTAVLGPFLALNHTDFKRLLADSTVGSLGMMMFLFGLGTRDAVHAALLYLFVHSLYKAALFMVAGSVQHATGTRDVLALKGLIHSMPVTAAAAALAALSMAGFPPLLGFLSKELVYQANLASPDTGWIFFGLIVFANILTVAIAFMVGIEPFFSRVKKTPKPAHEVSPSLWMGPLILGVLGLAIGTQPSLLAGWLYAASFSVLGPATAVDLKAWHGFNFIFLASAVTLVGGAVVYYLRKPVRVLLADMGPSLDLGPARAYHLVLDGTLRFAKTVTTVLQSGRLSHYVAFLALTLVALLGFVFQRRPLPIIQPEFSLLGGSEAVVALLISAAALVAAATKSRILAVTATGAVGFLIAALYVVDGAPDVALTQILVETLTVILTVFLISKLPRLRNPLSLPSSFLRATIAVAIGLLMTVISVALLAPQPDRQPISQFFAERSFIDAQGKNVVNVILVDFRALDTLGEITVLVLAALGVAVLLRKSTPATTEDS